MIQLHDVSKVFRTPQGEVRALDGVTLEIDDGEFVAVQGPSGCGKSTLLSLIGGLALPTSGRITVAGQAVSEMSSAARAEFRSQHVGFVFQLFHLLPYLTVLDNVLLAASTPEPSVVARAKELLARFGLSDRTSHRPGQLSVGQRQRVAMARAMLNQPKLLLADEPTGNLDPENAASLLDLLVEYRAAGGTILLVTHENYAAERAGRVLTMNQGQMCRSLAAVR
jgi:ABC-type lipoprotein export system ATPase subunit